MDNVFNELLQSIANITNERLDDAHERARRVFGRSHPDYIKIRKTFLLLSFYYAPRQGTLLMKDPNLNGKEVTILRATKDMKKYIVNMDTNAGVHQKVKVTPAQLILAENTPVGTEGNESDERAKMFVESFDEESNSYKIFMNNGADSWYYVTHSRDDICVEFIPQNSKLLWESRGCDVTYLPGGR